MIEIPYMKCGSITLQERQRDDVIGDRSWKRMTINSLRIFREGKTQKGGAVDITVC